VSQAYGMLRAVVGHLVESKKRIEIQTGHA
jgi:hypothetical protein